MTEEKLEELRVAYIAAADAASADADAYAADAYEDAYAADAARAAAWKDYRAAKKELEGELKACPFCGGGETVIYTNKGTWTGMKSSDPISVEVRHWCEKQEGQPSGRLLAFVGRDEISAIKRWNTRTTPKPLTADAHYEAKLAASEKRAAELEQGLCNIIKHQEIVMSGDSVKLSGTWNIAKAALEKEGMK